MALFKAAILQEGKKAHPVEIKLGTTNENGEKVPVILTLNMSEALMDVYKEAEEEYHASTRIPVLSQKEIRRRKRKGLTTEAKIVNDFAAYCKAIIEAGYLNSQNIIDEPTKENMLLAIEQEPGFAKQLAQALNWYFQGNGKFDFMEDDEKN